MDTAVVLIQEGGHCKSWPGGGFRTFVGVTPGALHGRCTNYVLVNAWIDGRLPAKAIVAIQMKTIGGAIAGRTPAAVLIGSTLFVSWHSLSASDNSDTSALLKECVYILEKYTDVTRIVIGGDFNASPVDIDAMILRGGGEVYTQVFAPPLTTPTHPNSMKVLDFFVILSKNRPVKGSAIVELVGASDHNAVIMDADW